MPVGIYKDRVDEYYRNVCLKTVERVAALSHSVVLPSNCVHHSRRDAERRIVLFGKSYYIFAQDDLTMLEAEKYRIVCGQGGE